MIDNSKQIGSTSVTHIRPCVHNTLPKKYPVIQTSVKHIKKGLYFMDPRERPLMGGFCSGVNMLKSIVTCKIICRLFGEFFFSFLAFSYRGHGWLFKYSDTVCSSFISWDRIVLKHCLYKDKNIHGQSYYICSHLKLLERILFNSFCSQSPFLLAPFKCK